MVSSSINYSLEPSIKKIELLKNLFKEEMMLLQKAIEIEKEKGQTILQAKAKRLQELTQRSDELLNSLILVENQRYTLIGELIEKYQHRLHSDSVNITNFLQVLREIKKEQNQNSNEWEKVIDDLIYHLKEFKKSAEQLKQEVETNQKLLIRTKNIVSDILDNFEKKDKTYITTKKQNITNNALLINHSV
jgi:uncharacterized protein YukE